MNQLVTHAWRWKSAKEDKSVYLLCGADSGIMAGEAEVITCIRCLSALKVAYSPCECGAEKCGHPGHSHWCPKALSA